MLTPPEAYKFEMLRAHWEAQQQKRGDSNPVPTTPGHLPPHQRAFYASATETRESKVRRFSSLAAFTSPLNSFGRRDRSDMPLAKSPSSRALVAPDGRQEPLPPLRPPPMTRIPSFHSSSSASLMPPPPPPKTAQRAPGKPRGGLLPKSQTTSNIPLLASYPPNGSNISPIQPAAPASRHHSSTGPRQPSQSANDLIRSRPPTPHRSSEDPLPVAAHSSNNLLSLALSQSSKNLLRSKIPSPAKDAKHIGASKAFAAMAKTPKTKVPRSYTQPNLTNATKYETFITPCRNACREQLSTKTPRFMASENSKPPRLPAHRPLPAIDDLFDSDSDLSDEYDLSELRRHGLDTWGSPVPSFQQIWDKETPSTPTTVKPRKTSDASARRPSQLPRLHSSSSIPQQALLTPLSPPFPHTPRQPVSQGLPPSGGYARRPSGASRPSLLHHSQLPPCVEFDSRSRASSNSGLRTPASPSPSASRLTKAVSQAQPPGYWAGRFSTVFDRLRLEHFDVEIQAFSRSGCISDTFGTFKDSAEEVRARKAFNELAAYCATDEARRSLRDFQRDFARMMGMPLCMPPVTLGPLALADGGADNEAFDEIGGAGKGKKTTFMEKLRGIARKSSA